MKRLMGILVALVICMSFTAAYAMPIKVEGNAIELAGECVQGKAGTVGSPASVSTTAFHVLGTDSEGNYLVYAEETVIKMTAEDYQGQIGDFLDVPELPNVDAYETLQRYSNGDGVIALQTALQQLGYLTGSADGNLGAQSEAAISAFQTAVGLEATNIADAITQALLFSMTAEEQTIDASVDPAKRYAVIAERIDKDISAFAEYGMKLTYDDIADEGYFSNGNRVTYEVDASNDLNMSSYDVQFILKLVKGNENALSVVPALIINNTGIRRPLMQEVMLKSGDKRGTYAVSEMNNGLVGANSFEEVTVMLDDNAVDLLAGAQDAGELKIRIEGKYRTVDIVVPSINLSRFSKAAQAAASMK